MKISDISRKVSAKLDSLIPDWRTILGEEILETIEDKEIAGEISFLRRLMEERRNMVYRENKERIKPVVLSFKDMSIEEFSNLFRDVDETIKESVLELTNSESEILKIIDQRLKDLESIKGAEEALDQTIEEIKERNRNRVENYRLMIKVTGHLMYRHVHKFDSSRLAELKPVIRNHLQNIQDENKAFIAAQENFMENDIRKVIREKSDSEDLDGLEITLTPQEVTNMGMKMRGMMKEFIDRNKKAKESAVYDILKRTVGIVGAVGLVEYIDKFTDLSCSAKGRLKTAIENGFMVLENFNLIGETDVITGAHDIITMDEMREISDDIKEAVEEREERAKQIFDDDIYQFCNGKWWAPLAHIGTVGFCSGYTFTYNILVLLHQEIVDWKGLMLVAETIIFFCNMPAGMVNLGAKFLNIVHAAATEEFMKQYLKKRLSC